MAIEKVCVSIQRIRRAKATRCNAFEAVKRGILSCELGKETDSFQSKSGIILFICVVRFFSIRIYADQVKKSSLLTTITK